MEGAFKFGLWTNGSPNMAICATSGDELYDKAGDKFVDAGEYCDPPG